MVSNLKYWSGKAINLRKSVPFVVVLAGAVVVALTALQPPSCCSPCFVVYALSGYVVSAWLHLRRRGPARRVERASIASAARRGARALLQRSAHRCQGRRTISARAPGLRRIRVRQPQHRRHRRHRAQRGRDRAARGASRQGRRHAAHVRGDRRRRLRRDRGGRDRTTRPRRTGDGRAPDARRISTWSRRAAITASAMPPTGAGTSSETACSSGLLGTLFGERPTDMFSGYRAMSRRS
jgi:hypothetical protein